MASPAIPPGDHSEIMPGLLQQAPDWLDTLIKSLPHEDKLALFQTCRSLAKQVVVSAEGFELFLAPPATLDSLDRRCNHITQLLKARRSFEVHLQGPGPHPFPTAIGDRVRHVSLLGSDEDIFVYTVGSIWKSVPNLESLYWGGRISEHELSGICEALEQGHLARLNDVEVLSCSGSDPVCRRLALALGRQLYKLCTDNAQLMQHLLSFQQLCKLDLYIYTVEASMRPALCSAVCKLPNLNDFYLNQADHLCGYDKVPGYYGFPEKSNNSEKRWFVAKGSPYHFLSGVPWVWNSFFRFWNSCVSGWAVCL